MSNYSNIQISNIEEIPGHEIVEFFSVVTGSTVRTKHLGKDIFAGLKNLVGGEGVFTRN